MEITPLSEIDLPEHARYGWNNDFSINWSDESSPEEIYVVVENVDEMYDADE